MRLATFLGGEQPDLVIALEKCGIRTEADLLFHPVIEIFRRLPTATATLQELEGLVDLVTLAASAPGASAATILDREIELNSRATALFSGQKDLDNLLGGFGRRRVLEFSGDQHSGKAFLALYLVLKHLSEDPNTSAVWIDTTGDFSIDSAAQIVEGFQLSKDTSSVLERLRITLAFDIDAAYQALDEAAGQEVSAGTEPNTCCFVINQITSLLGPNLTAVSSQGHAIMTDFMRRLRHHSRIYSSTVLVLNNSTAIKSKNPMITQVVHKPALGPSFAFLTDATLWLEKIDDVHDHDGRVSYSVHTVTVLRSKSSLSKIKSTFSISRGIISDISSSAA